MILSLGLKILLFIYAALITQTFSLSIWNRWDGPHYLDIAKDGYQTYGEQSLFIVFYPFYPLIVKIGSFIFGSFEFSAIIVSIILSIIASVFLYELTLLDFDKRVAFLSVLFLNIFPTAYFLQAPYTESLFLAVAIGSVYYFRTNRQNLAAVLGGLMGLTRINGLMTIPLFLLEPNTWKNKIKVSLFILLGFCTYLGINYSLFKNSFYFQKPLYSNWYKQLDWPWNGLLNLIRSIPDIHSTLFYAYSLEVLSLIFLFIATIFIFKMRKSYGVFALVNLLLITSTHFILSTPRYIIIVFPIFIWLASIRNRLSLSLIGSIFIVLLFYLTYIYTKGGWAF